MTRDQILGVAMHHVVKYRNEYELAEFVADLIEFRMRYDPKLYEERDSELEYN